MQIKEMLSKHKKEFGMVAGVLAVLVVVGAAVWYLTRPSLASVTEAYLNCLINQDYEGMYLLLSDSTKARVDHDTYIARNKNIYEGIEATNFEVSNITSNIDKKNKSYTVTYTMSFDTLAGELSYDYTMNFDRQDDNKYYINWYSNLIFPDLQENYKVRVYANRGKRGNILDRNAKALATTNEEGEREYPYGEVAAHLVGYIRGISAEELEAHKGEGYTESSLIGKTGLELAFEDRLRGKSGSGIYIVDENENTLKTLAETEIADGETIKTTIDIELQKQIYDEFSGDNGLSVVMNTQTGDVLAMVSTPSFDSNKFITGFTDEEWNSLNSNENTPMIARYESTWAPGSSFKPVTGAIGVSTNKFSANDDFGRSGTSWQNNSSWGDYRVTTLTTYSGSANLRNALIYSDNIYFAKAAIRIGGDTFAQQLLNIGFDKSIDFPISMSASQFAENNKFASEVQLADSGYGQGQVLVNPLHMASIYSAFVNEGNMIKPQIEISDTREYLVENAFSKEASNEIREDMIQVVDNSNGTGHEAKIDGVTIAGKTGTAELKSSRDEEGEELGWFNAIVVSDEESEQIVTINMIENVEDRGGSHYLLPKVKSIISSYVQ